MRVAIVGPRDYRASFAEIAYVINASGFDPTFILTGDANGVDSAVRAFARKYYPDDWDYYIAFWDRHRKQAGPLRNRYMINEGDADALIAFVRKGKPVSSGTASTIAEAVVKSIPIHIHEVEGSHGETVPENL